jgi:hypothetical protein
VEESEEEGGGAESADDGGSSGLEDIDEEEITGLIEEAGGQAVIAVAKNKKRKVAALEVNNKQFEAVTGLADLGRKVAKVTRGIIIPGVITAFEESVGLWKAIFDDDSEKELTADEIKYIFYLSYLIS